MIHIQISAPEHSGKTTLVALLHYFLKDLGANVKTQKADPQINDKLDCISDDLENRLKGVEILITEMQTYK